MPHSRARSRARLLRNLRRADLRIHMFGARRPAHCARICQEASEPERRVDRTTGDRRRDRRAAPPSPWRRRRSGWSAARTARPPRARPDCDSAATESDLDHRVAFPEGPTDIENLWPGGKADHRAKHAPWLHNRAGRQRQPRPPRSERLQARHRTPGARLQAARHVARRPGIQFSASELLEAIASPPRAGRRPAPERPRTDVEGGLRRGSCRRTDQIHALAQLGPCCSGQIRSGQIRSGQHTLRRARCARHGGPMTSTALAAGVDDLAQRLIAQRAAGP